MKQTLFFSPLFLAGGTSGNSVQQTDQITVLEGESVTMNCVYTSTHYPTLFWYVQYPNQALQFLQRETMENSKNFGARNIKDKNSPITKSTVQMSDSAVYYCLLRDTHSDKGTEGELYKNLRGLAEGGSWAGNPKLRSLVLSLIDSPVGTLLEGKERQNQLQLPLIPEAQWFFY